MVLKVVVIGAGGSGLCTIKNAIDYGCKVVAYEQSKFVGGLWNYTDNTEKDEYSIDVHSSLYQNLVTNLPIELMCYPNEPFPEQNESFVSSDAVLNYYQTYAKKYNLFKFIKFEHQVMRVCPLNDEKWEIIVKNLPENEISTHIFDAVLICTGHHHTPFIPKYKGHDEFKFKQIHSHVYRSSNIFQNEKVLIVGGNNSAVDLVLDSCKVSQFSILWSNHIQSDNLDLTQFEQKVISKPDVLELTKDGVKFIDGSYEEPTLIVYATGYTYSYPFLSVDSGIQVGDYVRPLWWHCLNIQRNNLAFIGLPNLICPNQMFDLQSQFCLTFITGKKKLPEKEIMMKEYENDMQQRWNRGLSARKGHFMGPTSDYQQNYYVALEDRADLKIIKKCIIKMHSHTSTNRFKHFTAYRKIKYHIIDDDNFKTTLLD